MTPGNESGLKENLHSWAAPHWGPEPARRQRRAGVLPGLAAKRPNGGAPSALGRRDVCPAFLAIPCATVAILIATSAPAAPPPAAAIQRLADDYLARRITPAFPQALTLEEARDARELFVKKLEPSLGRPVGHKVGLVSRAMQDRWGVDQPVRGVLLEKMLLPDNSEVAADCGAKPLLEADLIVVVKDKGINKAGTPLEVLKHLKEVVAFIELPDAFVTTNGLSDGAMLAAANVGARLGVLGNRVPVKPTQKFADALASMSVVMTDEAGLELGRGLGKAILDHPLNAVLWLIEDLQLAGESLKPGDLLSLGSIQMLPLPPAKSVTATYDGLPGGQLKVTVRLKPAAGPAK
jgi:2-keto-4-pentenoate hydratase